MSETRPSQFEVYAQDLHEQGAIDKSTLRHMLALLSTGTQGDSNMSDYRAPQKPEEYFEEVANAE